MAPVARVATVQLMTPNNGSDGATMRIGMKAADGSSGLAHTVDVRAARPNNTWENLGGAGDGGILNRDLAAAGIPKRDDRGHTVGVHAMRHTFGTHLSKGGVAPRTAQAAMRHSKLDLTMNVYTAPRLLDVAGALDVLPSLPLDDTSRTTPATATGTDARTLVPVLVPTTGNQSTQEATVDKTSADTSAPSQSVNDVLGKSSERLTRDDKKRVMGFEPTTFTLAT